MGKCQWQGFKGVGLPCIRGCANGETELSQSTNNHEKKKDQTCNGGLQSYCCTGFKPAPLKAQVQQQAADATKAVAAAAAQNAVLDVAAKGFCRVAVPALLAPLELLEDVIPIIGEIADLAEIAATPAIIEGCVKGVEKESKAEFKIFGKKHTLDINHPSAPLKDPRPPPKTHEPPKTSDKPSKTPTKSAGHVSETKDTSETPSSNGATEPRKCYSDTCGSKVCSAKRSLPNSELSNGELSNGDLSSSEFSKRVFVAISPAQYDDVEKLAKEKYNIGLSEIADRKSDWIPFDGEYPKSITVTRLEACTVIVAMSDRGLMASHMFESARAGSKGKAILKDTLNPDYATATISAVGARFAALAADLAGCQLLVMLPVNPIVTGKWKYDSEVSIKFTAAGTKRKVDPKTVNNPSMAAEIMSMPQTSTGIAGAKQFRYTPPETDEQSATEVGTWYSTIAAQYDPQNNGQQAYQVWYENQP